ncbi:MAG TPA: hypothetical protein VFJ82_14015 [Longimicrobium sp.]|nr:hypothetical protein [Longimicrobium sp.]
MRKLKLDLESIAVDSFAIAPEAIAAGSVEAQEMIDTSPYAKTILTYCPCTPRWGEV